MQDKIRYVLYAYDGYRNCNAQLLPVKILNIMNSVQHKIKKMNSKLTAIVVLKYTTKELKQTHIPNTYRYIHYILSYIIIVIEF